MTQDQEGKKPEQPPRHWSDPSFVLRWTEIAGPEVARIAQPLRLAQDKSGGVLTLKAEPGAALFLQHESRSLIARINAYLGAAAIQRLKFVQAPLAARPEPASPPSTNGDVPPGDPALSYDGPDNVRAALIALACRRNPRNPN